MNVGKTYIDAINLYISSKRVVEIFVTIDGSDNIISYDFYAQGMHKCADFEFCVDVIGDLQAFGDGWVVDDNGYFLDTDEQIANMECCLHDWGTLDTRDQIIIEALELRRWCEDFGENVI